MKIGTIGSGSIVDLMIDAIKRNPKTELYSVYSRTQERAAAFAKKHEAKAFFSDMDAFLADPLLETVYVASPNAKHYEQAKKALLAGKNVILEKTFVSNLEQAKELFQIAQEKDVYLMEAITVLHMPAYLKAKEWLSRIGQVRLANLNYSQYSSRYDLYLKKEVTNIFDPALEGGALRDINVYNLHAAVDLFGLPDTCAYYPNVGFNGVDCSGIIVLQYPGYVVTCMGAKDCGGPNAALFEGELGTLTAQPAGNLWTNVKLHVRSSQVVSPNLIKGEKAASTADEENMEFACGDFDNRMQYELQDFCEMVETKDRERYEYYKRETLQVMEILDRIS